MATTLASILREAGERLVHVTETPRLDAEILLAHALRFTRSKLLASLQDKANADRFDELLARREQGEPLAYILGHWEFFSRDILVEAPVLVPRPETEHLVEVVVEEVGESSAHVLEIGTGSGCVAITLACECPNASVTATDIRGENLGLARRNALRQEVERRIAFSEGDLFEPVERPYDVVCSNPPYIATGEMASLSRTIRDYEDAVALEAGADGLEFIRRLIAAAPEHLMPGGLLAFEFGAGQHVPIESLLSEAGFTEIRFVRDLAGIQRVAAARRN